MIVVDEPGLPAAREWRRLRGSPPWYVRELKPFSVTLMSVHKVLPEGSVTTTRYWALDSLKKHEPAPVRGVEVEAETGLGNQVTDGRVRRDLRVVTLAADVLEDDVIVRSHEPERLNADPVVAAFAPWGPIPYAPAGVLRTRAPTALNRTAPATDASTARILVRGPGSFGRPATLVTSSLASERLRPSVRVLAQRTPLRRSALPSARRADDPPEVGGAAEV